jgi:arylsulfatase A-like enzyme
MNIPCSSYFISGYVALLCGFLAGCGPSGKQPDKAEESVLPLPSEEKPESKATDQLPTNTGDEISQDQRDSAAATLAYFGPIDLKKLSRPMEIKPVENGSIVLLVIDAMNAQRMSMYGYNRPTTPTLDKLARDGLLLPNYVSNSSWTRPSFTTIITGLTKAQHQVELNGKPVDPDLVTLAERFRARGYRTAAFIGNPLIREMWGFGQGFQVFEDIVSMKTKAYPRDRMLIDKATDWLKRVKDKPFFLTFFLTAPHPPYRPPQDPRRFLKTVAPGKINEHPFKEYKKPLPKDEHDRIVAAYDDETAYVDWQISRLLEFLDQSGLRKRTAIIVTADHGELFGEHNSYLHAYHMWEPALRVPFILNAPGMPQTGIYDDRAFTHVDIAPTLFDLTGVEPGENEFTGVSIVEALKDRNSMEERIRFSQYNAHGVRREAARKGRYKLVHHHRVKKEAAYKLDELHPTTVQAHPRDLPSLAWDKERYEFYDLVEDPRELNDLFEKSKDSPIVAGLMAALRTYIEPRTAPTQLSP